MPGRKGIPNKRSTEAREKLDAIGFDPTLDPLLYFRGRYRRLHFD